MRINILDYFEKVVENRKDEIAVIHKDDSITFLELDRKARYLSALIEEITNGRVNGTVAVFMPKEIKTVIADIGIIYSGNAFMNLDIKTPIERIQSIVENINPVVIITYGRYLDEIAGLGRTVIDLALFDADTETDSEEKMMEMSKKFSAPYRNLIDTDPMCIINTSGSTGTPKGVILNHRSFWDFMDWTEETFHFEGTEVIGSLSPVVFDIFDFELCMLLTKGIQIVLLDAMLASFPARLLEELNKHKVSFIFWVPSIMVNIANMELLDKIQVPSLRTVWFAGEVFPTKQFNYWYDHFPETKFVNLYGPIEITLDCTYYIVDRKPNEDEPLPIGWPCHNTDVLILGEGDNPCQAGEEGELCVRGTSLAMGYYNNPEKTEAAFVQNPLNKAYKEIIYRTGDIVVRDEAGLIHFKGRKDSLIKHMGYRIELGEIEHMLTNTLNIVEYCCAVYQYEKREIILYYEKDSEITPAEFRNQLKVVFPAYMLPNKYIRMDLLPRNTNGKIDRLFLKNLANAEEG